MRQAVRHFEQISCTFTDYLERRKERVFSWNNIVMLCGLGLAADAEVAEQRGKRNSPIHLSQRSALLPFKGLVYDMMQIIT